MTTNPNKTDGAQQVPVTSVAVVLGVIIALTVFALTGLGGTIYLCRISSNPVLVEAAVKMIQTDPSSAMAALMLLRTDAAVIAIVSGLTGVAVGSLGGVLNSSRTQYAATASGSSVTVEGGEVSIKQPISDATGKPEPIPVKEAQP
jgi:hypothetical protein